MVEKISLPALRDIADPAPEIAALAARYRRANGPVMTLVNGLGGKIENRLEALPDNVKLRIEAVTRQALEAGYHVAAIGQRGPEMGERGHQAFASLTGAIGGLGGLPTAVAELPVTITVIFSAIRKVAQEHGFDPVDPATRAECLRVFASASPLAEDDGINTTFLGARLTVTGASLQRLIAAVAPRLAATMGQKLAAQAVPVLGAVAGAGLNYAFISYYRDMAHIRFGLLKLAAAHDPARIMADFAKAVDVAKITRD